METMTVNMENFPKGLWREVEIQAAKETIESGGRVNKKDIVIKALEQYLNKAKGF